MQLCNESFAAAYVIGTFAQKAIIMLWQSSLIRSSFFLSKIVYRKVYL